MKEALSISTFDCEVVFIDKENETKRNCSQRNYFKELLPNAIGLDMVEIPEGSIDIGSPKTEEGRIDDEEQYLVNLKSFFMSKYPITQAQWKAVALLPKVKHDLCSDPSAFKGLNRPVERVSWYDVIEFCARLSRFTRRSYRLPTEQDWEYACRAGTTTPFHFGETLTTDLVNYRGKDYYKKSRTRSSFFYKGSYGQGLTGIYREQTTDVGYFQVANAFGLYDLHGNVWEWCLGYPGESYIDKSVDSWVAPANDEELCQLPMRGGSWKSPPAACRSAFRGLQSPLYQEPDIGFRVVCSETSTTHPSIEELLPGLSSQSILENSQVGGNLTTGDINQNNTIIINNYSYQNEVDK